MFNYKVFVAEFVGTFALVFVGSAAGIYGQTLGLLGIALAHGLTLMAFLYMYGNISGTHINPAVTLGLALNGNVKWIDALVYWVAQFAGGVLAAIVLRTIIVVLNENAFAGAASSGLLTDMTKYPFYYAMAVEALLTLFLVTAFLHTSVGQDATPFAGIAIGLTLVVAILAGGPLTGASLNPARSFGPALFTSALDASRPDYQNPFLYVIFFVGPLLGAVGAVLLHWVFKFEPRVDEEMEDVEIIEEVEEVIILEKPEEQPARKPAPRKSTSRRKTRQEEE